jgi:DNA-binding NarL/FixJ family response regulator
VLVEDDPRFAEVVHGMLELEGFSVRTARSRAEALRLLAGGRPDVLLLDLGLPDCRGPDLVLEIVAMAVPVLVLTGARAPSAVLDAIRAGASGFLLKEDAVRQLVAAIDDVLGGHAPLSPDAVKALIDEVRAAPDSAGGARPSLERALTAREVEVVEQLMRGYTYEQVGIALGMSGNTVRTHVRAIYEKLGVSSRTEAVLSALQLGLIRAG